MKVGFISEKFIIIVLAVSAQGLIKNLANIVRLKNQKTDSFSQFIN